MAVENFVNGLCRRVCELFCSGNFRVTQHLKAWSYTNIGLVFKMEKKGVSLKECPKCGKEGLLIQKQTKTRGKTYVYWNVAHYEENYVSKSGKKVNKVRWCFLNKQQVAELQAKGVITQTVTQNVTQISDTQKVTQKEDLEIGSDFGKEVNSKSFIVGGGSLRLVAQFSPSPPTPWLIPAPP